MSINFALEYKKFEKEQQLLRAKYSAAGMSEDQITAIYEYDKQQLARDLAYKRRTQTLLTSDCGDDDNGDDGKSVLLEKFAKALSVRDDTSAEHDRYWWIEEIDTPELAKKLKSLSNDEIELLTLWIFDGYTQAEIAEILLISQRGVSKRIQQIAKKIKK